MEVSGKIRTAYAGEIPVVKDQKNHTTDTLVTKILLGTYGCVPAYDRYFVQALKDYNIAAQGFSKESVRNIARYYLENKSKFEELRLELNKCGTEYPAMKLIDMGLWQAEFALDKKPQE